MGNKKLKLKIIVLEELNKNVENNLDISNVDKLQIKAIKDLNNRIKEKKSDRIFYILPAINLCVPSLI